MPQPEIKICQNCKQQFIIESDDFDFYKKVNVPAPTWCPECLMVRKMIWRNERALYKRECDLCGKSIITVYKPDLDNRVYCHPCWISDKWNGEEYAQEYDWDTPFFVQWRKLFGKVPKFDLFTPRDNPDSAFVNYAGWNKNCYLSYSVVRNENVMYSRAVDDSKDALDCLYTIGVELCYANIEGENNYNCKYLLRAGNCVDCAFLFDCINCKDCFLSTNLRNKRYVFENVQYTRDEYLKKLEGIDFGSASTTADLRERFLQKIRERALHKFAQMVKSVNCTGHFIGSSKNVRNSFDVYRSEDCKYSARLIDARDVFSSYGVLKCERVYESFAPGVQTYNYFFSFCGDASRNVFYSPLCYSSFNLFGCVGLRNKQYCILNKQYSKQEYEKLVPKIVQHMNAMPYKDKKGRVYTYGEFFPAELSPFAYNETIAQEYFPLTKEQAIEQGYEWKDPERKEYKVTATPEDLPDHIKDVKDDIIKQIIGCAHSGKCNEQCTTAFKIIPDELQFYKKMNLPLPRLCPNCRHYQRLRQRNPLRLWHRKCQCAGEKSDNGAHKNTVSHFHKKEHCPNEFETTYAPERKEIIYCKKCYQSEVV
ncbi:hypothetical protein MYX07_02985 [Patescibacteria group bacterium AH-259-L07]|nr:hypothetical protein [Patescibacteria group bacterium AH-259-L07]